MSIPRQRGCVFLSSLNLLSDYCLLCTTVTTDLGTYLLKLRFPSFLIIPGREFKLSRTSASAVAGKEIMLGIVFNSVQYAPYEFHFLPFNCAFLRNLVS